MCLQNEVDLMVEDEPQNCLSISEHIPVLCMSYKYNECLEGLNNLAKVENWAEIFNTIMKYVKQKQAV